MKIELGQSCGMGCPAPVSSSDSQEKHYPNVYLDLPGDASGKFPHEGKIVFSFECSSKNVNIQKNGEGEPKITTMINLKLLSIEDIKEEKKKVDDRKEAEGLLDKYASDASKEENSDDGY